MSVSLLNEDNKRHEWAKPFFHRLDYRRCGGGGRRTWRGQRWSNRRKHRTSSFWATHCGTCHSGGIAVGCYPCLAHGSSVGGGDLRNSGGYWERLSMAAHNTVKSFGERQPRSPSCGPHPSNDAKTRSLVQSKTEDALRIDRNSNRCRVLSLALLDSAALGANSFGRGATDGRHSIVRDRDRAA